VFWAIEAESTAQGESTKKLRRQHAATEEAAEELYQHKLAP
jgi:hypothetical protein